MPERYPAACKIVGGYLYGNAVPLEHPDAEAAHIAGKGRQHFMALADGHAKRRVGEDIDHRALELNRILF